MSTDRAPKLCQSPNSESVWPARDSEGCVKKVEKNVVAAIGTIRNRARKIAHFQLLLAKFYLLLELFVGIIARLAT